MRDKPSRRRFLKWAGASVCIGIVVTTMLSTQRRLCYTWGTVERFYTLDLNCGAVVFHRNRSTTTQHLFVIGRGWELYSLSETPGFNWKYQSFTLEVAWGSATITVVPLWILLLLAAIPTVVLWLRDRRYPPGHCRKCGYDLTGNVSGICPECGTAIRAGGDPSSQESA